MMISKEGRLFVLVPSSSWNILMVLNKWVWFIVVLLCRAYDNNNFEYVPKKEAFERAANGEILVATTYVLEMWDYV